MVSQFLLKHWFFIGVISVILMAYIYPSLGVAGGPLRPEISVKLVGVSLIFLNSGLSIKTRDFTGTLTKYDLHILIQGYTMIFIPFLVNSLSPLLLLLSVNTWIVNGLQVVSCLPPPVSSAVILTKAIGGNEAASILNSALGSFLGVLFSPVLIYLSLGLTSTVPFLSIALSLTLTVLLPLVLGQLLRHYWLEDTLEPYKPYLSNFASCILLAIIYTAFCGTFHQGYAKNISLSSLLSIVLIELIMQLFFLSLAFILSTRLMVGFKRSDVICILFCSTHKSLTLGIPMLGVMFGNTKDGVLYSIPLLVYHPMQILLGSLLVPVLKEWVLNKSEIGWQKASDETNEDPVDTTVI